MHLHRPQNPLLGLQPVEVWSLTSFPAHNLGDSSERRPQMLLTEQTLRAGTGSPASHLVEIRPTELPFAAPLPLQSQLAAA